MPILDLSLGNERLMFALQQHVRVHHRSDALHEPAPFEDRADLGDQAARLDAGHAGPERSPVHLGSRLHECEWLRHSGEQSMQSVAGLRG